MDSEQDIPGSDKLFPWPLKKENTHTKYTKCTKYK